MARTQRQKILTATKKSIRKRDLYSEKTIGKLTDALDSFEDNVKSNILRYEKIGLGDLREGQTIHLKALKQLESDIGKLGTELKGQQSLIMQEAVKHSYKAATYDGIDALVAGKLPFYADLTNDGIAQVSKSIFQLVDKNALDFLANFQTSLAGEVTKDLTGKIMTQIQIGIASGEDVTSIVRNLGKVIKNRDAFAQAGATTFKNVQTRMRMIARTEVIRAHNAGNIKFYDRIGIKKYVWNSVLDERTPSGGICEQRDGQVFVVNKDPAPPEHPNCVVGDTKIYDNPDILAVSKRWHKGNIVTIRTLGGKKLTVTENHPVLTWRSGWKSAAKLREGDKLICGYIGKRPLIAGNDNHDIPPTIENIAHAFRSTPGVSTREVPLSTPDFHGDIVGDDVAIISSYGNLLPDVFDTVIQEHINKSDFEFADILKNFLIGLRSHAFLSPRHSATANSIMSSFNLFRSLLIRHLTPLQSLGIAAPSIFTRKIFLDDPSNNKSCNSIISGERGTGHSTRIKVDNIRDGKIDSDTDRSVFIPKNYLDDFEGHTELSRQISSGASGEVFSDDIIDISISEFSGHVYNLQTKSGWFSAEGIITHNCRCWTEPFIDDDTKILTPEEINLAAKK